MDLAEIDLIIDPSHLYLVPISQTLSSSEKKIQFCGKYLLEKVSKYVQKLLPYKNFIEKALMLREVLCEKSGEQKMVKLLFCVPLTLTYLAIMECH